MEENTDTAENTGNKAGEKAPRSVYISSKALVRTYKEDGTVEDELVPRNTYTLSLRLKEYDPNAVIGIYLVEDEEQSDPPAEGEARQMMPLFPAETDKDGNRVPVDRMTVVDALSRLAAATTPDQAILARLHQDCDRASATSHYDCGVYTMVFGGKPCGFAYLNSCRDVPASSLALLYETAKSQVASLKESLRKIAPGIRFSDDPEPQVELPPEKPGIVLPSGMPAEAKDAGIVTPQEAEKDMLGKGLTRIVQIVD